MIPALCLDGPIVPASRHRDGSLAVPNDVAEVGLWTDGAPLELASGSQPERGTTLLAGHVNYVGQGQGTLGPLYRVAPGTVIYATTAAGGVTRWQVVAATAVRKSRLPAEVFVGRSGPRRLTLVTCGGSIHRSGHGWTYDDNVVVTAVPS